MRDGIQPFFILATEVDDPAVIRPRVGGGEFRVGDPTFPDDANGGVEEGDINALAVHDSETRDRIIAARRTAVRIGALARREKSFGLCGVRAHPAQRAQGSANDVQGLVVEHEDFPAVVVMFEAHGPVSILRINIFLPGIEWLQHMAVSIHNRSRTLRRHITPPHCVMFPFTSPRLTLSRNRPPTRVPISFPIT